MKYVEKEGDEEGFIPVSKKRRGRTKGGLVAISFVDYLTHDIPLHIIANSENTFDLEQAFHQLKEMGYPLKVIVCDEKMIE